LGRCGRGCQCHDKGYYVGKEKEKKIIASEERQGKTGGYVRRRELEVGLKRQNERTFCHLL
jgi:hypothetical protein